MIKKNTRSGIYFTGESAFANYSNQPDITVDDHTVTKSKAYSARTFVGHDTNISVRSDYGRADYEYFRPSDSTPQQQQDIIQMCMEVYRKVGLVRNVIDLMGDFGSQGIRLQHPVVATQSFYDKWWKKVGATERSERFLNQLYRQGQVIVRRSYGKVSVIDERKWRKGIGIEDTKLERPSITKREIPLKYSFINPCHVDIVGGELTSFVGQPVLALRISAALSNIVRSADMGTQKMAEEIRDLVSKIPPDIRNAILKGERIIPLDMAKTSIHYYKKDDWMKWADPMCHSILDDIIMLNKLKLADISALDGAISSIRLWTLGIIGDGPQNTILPTKAAINKLRNILANNVGGGVMDLVWGPELKLAESNSQIWRWLGPEKYQYTVNAIYEGLGIPAPLRGGANGTTNTGNFIGLNTLIKRLQYGRDRLIEFWTGEIDHIHKAMSIPGKPPEIVFDFMVLADEAAEKQLLINLWDRDIISDDTILEIFGRKPVVEKSRVKKETTERINEAMPYKASPYHNPDKEHEYRKILLQGGGVAPSEIGIDLNDRKVGEKTRLEQMEESQLKLKDKDIQARKVMQKNKPVGTPGRPNNVTETKKRKKKPTEKPSTKANFIDLFMWANFAQDKISDIANSSLLYSVGKSNMRSLTKDESELIDKVKLNILCQLKPLDEITDMKVYGILEAYENSDKSAFAEISGIIRTLKAQFAVNNGRQPKIEELRQIYSSAYALFYE